MEDEIVTQTMVCNQISCRMSMSVDILVSMNFNLISPILTHLLLALHPVPAVEQHVGGRSHDVPVGWSEPAVVKVEPTHAAR